MSKAANSRLPKFKDVRGQRVLASAPSTENMCENAVCFLVIGPSQKHSLETCVYLSQNGGVPPSRSFSIFQIDSQMRYEPFCDDFGPMNALSIARFVKSLDDEIARQSQIVEHIVYCAEEGAKGFTNAAFLLGCYMMTKLNMDASKVHQAFQQMDPWLFEGYRDASRSSCNFRLELIDCWRGIERGIHNGWFSMPTEPHSSTWGTIDMAAYAHYDNPLNADLHEVIPGHLIVFRGPRDLGGKECRNVVTESGAFYRDFSPEYYIPILKELGVTTIVQLNQPQYDPSVFTSAGFRHVYLLCENGPSTPPAPLVSHFFRIMDESPGLVAVHGRSSFGRAGTLAALQLMRKEGFGAREAMAWVRIMRPGCIIGSQQSYLCSIHSSITNILNQPLAAEPHLLQQHPPHHQPVHRKPYPWTAGADSARQAPDHPHIGWLDDKADGSFIKARRNSLVAHAASFSETWSRRPSAAASTAAELLPDPKAARAAMLASKHGRSTADLGSTGSVPWKPRRQSTEAQFGASFSARANNTYV